MNKMANTLDDKIKLAEYYLSNRWIPYGDKKFTLIYPFTTEDLGGIFPHLDLGGKSIVTLGSSGDQQLNAIYFGCKRVYVVDICPFAKETFYMKSAAVLSLIREEMLAFFGQPINLGCGGVVAEALDERLWPRVHEYIMDDETKEFWKYLFNRHSSQEIWKFLFDVHDTPRYSLAHKINPYLASDESYMKMREALSTASVTFTVKDIFDGIGSAESFDVIYLSNIAAYCSPIKTVFLCRKVMNNLNDDGIIMAAYSYGMLGEKIMMRELYNNLKMFFGEGNIDTLHFDSHIYPNPCDCAILVKSRK